MGHDYSTTSQLDIRGDFDISVKPSFSNSYVYTISSKKTPGKSYYDKIIHSPSRIDQIEKNIDLFKVIQHPNIIQFIGYDQYLCSSIKGYVYHIVSEKALYNLNQFLSNSPDYFDNIANVLDFVSQMMNALYELHLHNVYHGNIKPENILMTRKYCFKIDLEVPHPKRKTFTGITVPVKSNGGPLEYQNIDLLVMGLVFLHICGVQNAFQLFSGKEKIFDIELSKALKVIEDKYNDNYFVRFMTQILSLTTYHTPDIFSLKHQFPSIFTVKPNTLKLHEVKQDSFTFLQTKNLEATPYKSPIYYSESQRLMLPDSTPITKILMLSDTRLITSSDIIAFWNLQESKLKPTKTLGITGRYFDNIIKLTNDRLACTLSDCIGTHILSGLESPTIYPKLGEIAILNLLTYEFEKIIPAHQSAILPIVELPLNIIISGSLDGSIKFWDLNKPTEETLIHVIQSPLQSSCNSIVLLNKDLMACTSSGSINVYNIIDGKHPINTFGEDRAISHLNLLPDGKTLLAWSIFTPVRGGKVTLFDWKEGSPIRTLMHPDLRIIGDLQVCSDKVVITGCLGGVMFWNHDLEKRSKPLSAGNNTWIITAIGFDGRGNMAVAGPWYRLDTLYEDAVKQGSEAMRGNQVIFLYD